MSHVETETEIEIVLRQVAEVFGGEFLKNKTPAHGPSNSAGVLLCDKLRKACGIDSAEDFDEARIKKLLLDILSKEVSLSSGKVFGLISQRNNTFREAMIEDLQSESLTGGQKLYIYAVYALRVLISQLEGVTRGIALFTNANSMLSAIPTALGFALSEDILLNALTRRDGSLKETEQKTLADVLALFSSVVQSLEMAKEKSGFGLDLVDKQDLKDNVFRAIIQHHSKVSLDSIDRLVLQFLQGFDNTISVSTDDDKIPDMRSLSYFFKYLDLKHQAKVKALLLELSNPDIEEGAVIQASIQLALLAARGAAAALPDDGGAWIDEYRKNSVLAVYNHFAMRFAAYCPVALIQFDHAFKQSVFASTSVFKCLFGFSGNTRYRDNVLLKADYRENEYKPTSVKVSGSLSRSKEVMKFLMIQQVVMTAGAIYANEANVRAIKEYLSVHRTWWGKALNAVFGYKTAALNCYEDYRVFADTTKSKSVRDAKKQEVNKYLTEMRAKHGAFVIQGSFAGIATHATLGLDVAAQGPASIAVH